MEKSKSTPSEIESLTITDSIIPLDLIMLIASSQTEELDTKE